MSSLNARPKTQIILSIVLAGLIGEVVFELYAWFVSPVLFDVVLQPSNLVIAITAKLTGVQISKTVAFPIHFLIGSLGFGLFVYATRLIMPARVWFTGLRCPRYPCTLYWTELHDGLRYIHPIFVYRARRHDTSHGPSSCSVSVVF